MWNWQQAKWPEFTWARGQLQRAEQRFVENAGMITGATHHYHEDEQSLYFTELFCSTALHTSEIEGENLHRESVRSSIAKALGLQVVSHRATAAEAGIAKMTVTAYQSHAEPLSHTILKTWHRLLMNGRHDLDQIGAYRTHQEAMQIVSGVDYRRIIHFEAPPSHRVQNEMTQFLSWFNRTQRQASSPLGALTRAAIAHIWFESIHPFEDGNGRIGRAIAEKALIQGTSSPTITLLSKVLLKRRKEYYAQLHLASQSLELTAWIVWFASVCLEAQQYTLAYIDFIKHKTQLFDRLRDQLNPRQEKVLRRMFREGPEGFAGGLSAKNYMSITGAKSATTTRDLQDLVKKSALKRTGTHKSTRYHLTIPHQSIATIGIEDIV